MFPVIQVGSFSLQVPGLVLLAGIWFGLALAERTSRRFGLSPDSVYNIVLFAILAGLVGGRLAFFASHPEPFLSRPLDLLSLRPGLVDLPAGLGASGITFLIYAQRKRIPIYQALDALVVFFAAMRIAISLAELASGAGYGLPNHSILGIELWGEPRHLTQAYDALAGAAILMACWPAENIRVVKTPGTLFFQFVTLTALSALLVEGFRAEGTLLSNGIRFEQIVGWIIAAASTAGWYSRLQFLKHKQETSNG